MPFRRLAQLKGQGQGQAHEGSAHPCPGVRYLCSSLGKNDCQKAKPDTEEGFGWYLRRGIVALSRWSECDLGNFSRKCSKFVVEICALWSAFLVT